MSESVLALDLHALYYQFLYSCDARAPYRSRVAYVSLISVFAVLGSPVYRYTWAVMFAVIYIVLYRYTGAVMLAFNHIVL